MNHIAETESPCPVFDLQKEFEEKLLPFLKTVDMLCIKLDIPYVFAACIAAEPVAEAKGAVACHVVARGRRHSEGWAPDEFNLFAAMLENENCKVASVSLSQLSQILRAAQEVADAKRAKHQSN